MIIALDYDDTWTADPGVWLALLAAAKGRGHTVIMVTQRAEGQSAQIRADLAASKVEIPVVYAYGQAKRDAAIAAGYEVDVWIDDTPYGVNNPRWYQGAWDHELPLPH